MTTVPLTIHLDRPTRRAVELRALARNCSVSKAGADLIRKGLEEPAVIIRDTCPGWRVGVIFAIALIAAFLAGWAANGGP